VSAAAMILDRLERVKQTAPGKWLARCPAHEDRSPSLSVRDIDGRVLIHDFGGCDTSSILAALGLQMSDLFETPLADFGPSRSRLPARDLLQILDHEIVVVCIILADVIRDRRINEVNYERLAMAASRIAGARDHANA
jgi:hypothetical protein